MLAALIFAALLTNTYFEEITHDWINLTGFAARDLFYWQLWRFFTMAVVTTGGHVFWEALLFVAAFVGTAEWLAGSRRVALTFWGIHVFSLVLLSFIITVSIHQLRSFGFEASQVARDVGPSAGYFACLGLVSATLKRPWHWISGAGIWIMLIVMLFLPVPAGESAALKFSADLVHLLAFPLGWLSYRIGKKGMVPPKRT